MGVNVGQLQIVQGYSVGVVVMRSVDRLGTRWTDECHIAWEGGVVVDYVS